jgi:hypothetical protein
LCFLVSWFEDDESIDVLPLLRPFAIPHRCDPCTVDKLVKIAHQRRKVLDQLQRPGPELGGLDATGLLGLSFDAEIGSSGNRDSRGSGSSGGAIFSCRTNRLAIGGVLAAPAGEPVLVEGRQADLELVPVYFAKRLLFAGAGLISLFLRCCALWGDVTREINDTGEAIA